MTPEIGAPSVSIVITCYNQGRFLTEAVESALGQSVPPAEVVVVDDGSSDETAAVAAAFTSASYVHQPNAGVSSARNTGLKRSRGEYVLFLDADDVLLSNALADALAAFASTPDAAFVYGGYREVDSERAMLFEAMPDPAREGYAGLLRSNHIAMHGTVLYRAAVLRKAGGFDPQLRCCEDYDVYLKLARRGSIAAYPTVAAEYRRHGSNATGDAALMLSTALEVMRRQRGAASASPELLAAYREGVGFWRDYYGERIVGQVWREFETPQTRRRGLRSLAIGLRGDPRFVLRLWRRAVQRFGPARA